VGSAPAFLPEEDPMEVLYPRCAGLDVHRDTVVACARIAGGQEAKATREVRTFGTTTGQC
jgi:hypothetical protein